MTSLLVSEINFINGPFLWFVSFFRPVHVVFLAAHCPKLFLRRLNILDLNNLLEPGETQVLRDTAYEQWEKVASKVRSHDWTIRHGGKAVDLSIRLSQTLGLFHERYYILKRLAGKMPTKPVILDTVYFRTLRERFIPPEVEAMQRLSALSPISRFLDLVNGVLISLLRAFKLAGQVSLSAFQRGAALNRQDIRLLWDAVNPHEMTLNPEKRFFAWALDRDILPAKNVLFILPCTPTPELKRQRAKNVVNALTMSEIYALVPAGIKISVLLKLLWVTFFQLPRACFVWKQQMLSMFTLEILCYEPLLRSFNIKAFVECISQIGHEGAHVAFMEALGIHTLLYSFSANSYHWTKSSQEKCYFRNTLFSNIQAAEFISWHNNFSRFVSDHIQVRTRPKVIGPLMPGREAVMREDRNELRKKMGLPVVPGAKYVSFFDIAPFPGGHMIPDFYPTYYTDDFMGAFIQDMIRLYCEFSDMVLIYKPKRPLADSRFAYSKTHTEVVSLLNSSPRGCVLDDDVNPWLPIAASDICIGVPFTSTVVAAVHYGRSGFFYDPLNIVTSHRYHSIDLYISHNFEDLRRKLNLTSNLNHWKQSDWKDFIGSYPGCDSSLAFRKLLREHAFS